MFTHYTVIAVRRYLVRGAIATRTIIAVFGSWCEGRSILRRDGAIATRTIIAVFGIWCEGRSLFHFRRSLIRNNKGRCYAMLFSLTSAIGSTIATKATGIGTK
jgi:hypothetical protein